MDGGAKNAANGGIGGGIGGGRRTLRNGGAISRIVAAVTSKYRQSWRCHAIERMDPLYGMSANEAQQIFNLARGGNYARLQFLYNEIERTDPTLLVCVSRRAAALSELDWKVTRSSERLTRGADEGLVREQVAFLEEAVAKIRNLPEAVEHLALASFRGFSHLSPVYEDARMTGVRRLDCLDGWNFCYDQRNGSWLWNPDASGFCEPTRDTAGLEAIPPEELVSVTCRTAIDWPALMIFLRASVGERDWARFLETYGIPPVILTMPEFASEDEQSDFEKAAEAVYEGGNGVVPNGTQVSYASESRGTNPFTEFLEHQQKLVVLMATGGTLTSLAESGSGTLGGNAQMDVWRQIVRRDVRIIANALDKQLCEPLVRRAFPGEPVLAEFSFDTSPDRIQHAKKVLELAGLASSAGLEMDVDELSNECGFSLARKPTEGGYGGVPGMDAGIGASAVEDAPEGGFAADMGEEETVAEDGAEVGSAGGSDGGAAVVRNAVGGASPVPKGGAKGKGVASPAERLAAALQDEYAEVAERIADILALPEDRRAAAASALIGELDRLVPEDGSMAEAIAEVMAETFERQGVAANRPPVRNAAAENGGADGDTPPGIPNSECHVRGRLCRIHDAKDVEALKAKTPEQHVKDGKAAVEKSVSLKCDVLGASWREATGPIDFEYGFAGTPERDYHDGYGLAHIARIHPKDLYAVPGVLAHGSVWRDPGRDDRLAVISGSRLVLVERDGDGSFVVTGFTPDAPRAYLARFRSGEMVEGEK